MIQRKKRWDSSERIHTNCNLETITRTIKLQEKYAKRTIENNLEELKKTLTKKWTTGRKRLSKKNHIPWPLAALTANPPTDEMMKNNEETPTIIRTRRYQDFTD